MACMPSASALTRACRDDRESSSTGGAMRRTARIIYTGGMLMLPARTPYDFEQILDALDWYSAHHGGVRFQFDGHDWLVRRPLQHGVSCGCGPLDVCRRCIGSRLGKRAPHRAR